MNLLIAPGDWLALGPLSAFLPFALAGFVTFAIRAVHSLAQFFADRPEDSK